MPRSDLFAVFFHAVIGGNWTSHGEFDTYDGGGWSVDSRTYYPPGSIFPVQRGGKAEVEEVTVEREWQPARDDVLWRLLKDHANTPARVTMHNRLANQSVVLAPFAIYEGILGGVTPPPYNSQEASDANISITILPSGPIG